MMERAALGSDGVTLQQTQEQLKKLQAENARLTARLRELEEAQHRDALTGTLDRGGIDATLEREWLRSRRGQVPLGLVFIDVDHFKDINDQYGHQVGDIALKTVAQAIEAEARRSSEVVGRYGGDEFVVIVPQADLETTLALGERLRLAVAQARCYAAEDKPILLSVSVGAGSAIATIDRSVAELVRRADRAVYAAKERGRGIAVGCDVEAGVDIMFGVRTDQVRTA